jgi:spore germination protein KC
MTKVYLPNKARYPILIVLLISLLATAGCWNQVEVTDTAEAEGIAFDLQQNQPAFSVQLAKPGGQSESGSQPSRPINLTSTGQTYTEAARSVLLSLPRLPLWAHSGVVLFGEELAGQDVALVADFIARNRNVRKTSMVFVTKGVSAQDCLEAELPLETYSIAGLKKLIETQEQQLGYYAPVTLDQFLEDLSAAGVQPAIPQVTLVESNGKKVLRLDGTAVFKNRRVVGSLNQNESQGYRYLSSKMITGGLIIVDYPQSTMGPTQHNKVTFELTRSQATAEPVFENGRLKMRIKIEAEGNFYEQNFTGEILTFNNIKTIENLADAKIEEQIVAAITAAQGMESDIFGWGRMIRRQQPEVWSDLEEDWPARFAAIEPEITIHFAMRRAYLLDQSFEFKE